MLKEMFIISDTEDLGNIKSTLSLKQKLIVTYLISICYLQKLFVCLLLFLQQQKNIYFYVVNR